MKWVAHIYLANFYTSVQLGRQPELEDEAVLVLQHNRVIDCTAQAETAGVKLRSSGRHAYQNCPGGLFVDYGEEDYREAAAAILDSCLAYTPVIEPIAENEFYLELAGPKQPDQVIRELIAALVPAYATGLCAGIGQNKFLARVANMLLASGRIAPEAEQQEHCRGAFAVPVGKFHWLKDEPGPEAVKHLEDLPLLYLWNLDSKLRKRLMELGFTTIGDLAGLGPDLLQQEFPAQARLISELIQGRYAWPVLSLYPPQQLVEEIKFAAGIADFVVIEHGLAELALKLHCLLLEQGKGCRRIILQAQSERGEQRKSRTFSRPQNSLVSLREVLKSLLHGLNMEAAVNNLRVTADDLRPLGQGVQLSLFEDPKGLAGQNREMQAKLPKLLESLGQRFAPHNFQLAKELPFNRREQMLQFWDPLRFAKVR